MTDLSLIICKLDRTKARSCLQRYLRSPSLRQKSLTRISSEPLAGWFSYHYKNKITNFHMNFSFIHSLNNLKIMAESLEYWKISKGRWIHTHKLTQSFKFNFGDMTVYLKCTMEQQWMFWFGHLLSSIMFSSYLDLLKQVVFLEELRHSLF